MKHEKVLLRRHKLLLSKLGYDPGDYWFIRELVHTLILKSKTTGEIVIVEKGA